MKFSIKPYWPMAVGLTLFSACSKPIDRANSYMKNRASQVTENVDFKGNMAYTQSKLDSIAYRDVFETSEESKDSSNIANFNEIAKRMRGYRKHDLGLIANFKIKHSAKDVGMPRKIYKSIFGKTFSDISDYQHESDKWAYGNFFEKLGLMKNEDFAKKFEEVSNKIEP